MPATMSMTSKIHRRGIMDFIGLESMRVGNLGHRRITGAILVIRWLKTALPKI